MVVTLRDKYNKAEVRFKVGDRVTVISGAHGLLEACTIARTEEYRKGHYSYYVKLANGEVIPRLGFQLRKRALGA